jgi:hypothetical protein
MEIPCLISLSREECSAIRKHKINAHRPQDWSITCSVNRMIQCRFHGLHILYSYDRASLDGRLCRLPPAVSSGCVYKDWPPWSSYGAAEMLGLSCMFSRVFFSQLLTLLLGRDRRSATRADSESVVTDDASSSRHRQRRCSSGFDGRLCLGCHQRCPPAAFTRVGRHGQITEQQGCVDCRVCFLKVFFSQSLTLLLGRDRRSASCK